MLDDLPGLMVSLNYTYFMLQGPTEEEVDVLVPRAGNVLAHKVNCKRLKWGMEDDTPDFEHILSALKKHIFIKIRY